MSSPVRSRRAASRSAAHDERAAAQCSMLYLKSRRVLLRQYRDEDFDRLIELSRDPEVMRYLTNGEPATREDVEKGVANTRLYKKKYGGKLGVFTAELLEDGEFMGWFLLRPSKAELDHTKELELGYRLKKKFWRKGYATEVSLRLLRKAFDELGADVVFAQTLAANLPSRRVMEKIGMRFEKEFLDPDYPREGSAVLYRLHRSDDVITGEEPICGS